MRVFGILVVAATLSVGPAAAWAQVGEEDAPAGAEPVDSAPRPDPFAEAESEPVEALQQDEVVMRTVRAAIGLQTTRVRLYHNEAQSDPERDPYAMDQSLVRAAVTYDVGATLRHRADYDYDSDGRLRAVRLLDEQYDETLKALWITFERKRLVSVRSYSGPVVSLSLARRAAKATAAGFTRAQRKQAHETVRQSREYAKLFRRLLRVEQVGKE